MPIYVSLYERYFMCECGLTEVGRQYYSCELGRWYDAYDPEEQALCVCEY